MTMKRWMILLLALALCAPTALGQEDVYRQVIQQGKGRLVAVPSFEEEAAYIFHTAAPQVASPEYFTATGQTPDQFLGIAGQTQQSQFPGAQLGYRFLSDNRNIYPISLSPDGQTLLMGEGSTLLLKREQDLYPLSLNIQRSGGEEQAVFHLREDADARVGTEGVVWSPDGRYIAFPFAARNEGTPGNWPLMLADTQTKELFAAKVYHGPLGNKLTAYAQGVFSPDSQWLYYTENINDILRLCRYHMDSGTHELLLDTGLTYHGRPGMGCDGEGRLVCALIREGETYLAAFTPQGETYTLDTRPLPGGVLPHLVQTAPGTVMTRVSGLSPSQGAPFTYLINDRALLPVTDSQGQVSFAYSNPLTAPEDMEAFRDSQLAAPPDTALHSLAVRPDGRYAFAVAVQGEGNVSLHLIDLQSLASAPLTVSEEDAQGVPALAGDRFSHGLFWYGEDGLFTAPFMGVVKQFHIQAQ